MTPEMLSSLHCLIVDDDPGFLSILETMLRRNGVVKISTARSVLDAARALNTNPWPIDVILCGVMTDGRSGLDLLKSIRTGKHRSTRLDACFILLSETAEVTSIKAAAGLDANGYLVKPIVPEKLRSAIIKGRSRNLPADIGRYSNVVTSETSIAKSEALAR